MVVTALKIPLYDEPEGVYFLAADAVLGALILLARRSAVRRGTSPARTRVSA
jgi:hypothetical protein